MKLIERPFVLAHTFRCVYELSVKSSCCASVEPQIFRKQSRPTIALVIIFTVAGAVLYNSATFCRYSWISLARNLTAHLNLRDQSWKVDGFQSLRSNLPLFRSSVASLIVPVKYGGVCSFLVICHAL